MAKSSKTKTDKIDSTDVEDQSVEMSEEGEGAQVTSDESEVAIEGTVDVLSEDVPDLSDDTLPEPPEDAAEPETPTEPDPQPAAQRSDSGSFLMLLLGGVAAGAIGYGIGQFGDRSTEQLQAQAQQIAALQERLDNLPTPDLSAIETQISDVAASVDQTAAALGEEVAALEARLFEVEKQPNADGTLSDTALQAYQQELDALRAELDDRQGSVMSAAAQAEADLAAARAEAERLEQEALAAAEAAQARAAINRIAAAVETGAPFADALSDLDTDVAAALADAAETGVATTASLVADFPAAARSALAVARSEGVSDDAGGIGGFLRSQFDVRSTTPQEGPGPDAVLSRAEAAVKEGRVADALAEIEALPEVVRADLTGWTSRAQQRAEVLDALSALSETYQ